MKAGILTPRKSLNKAFLKVKPYRPEFETFKKNLLTFIDQINDKESEEFHKNVLSEFLKNTYYSPDHYINTRGRFDLVIHTGKDTTTPVGVLFETKRPADKTEMPSENNLNTKAIHELLLYWLQERITGNNLEIKYLIATDMYDWFIFNAGEFERLFAGNKQLVKQFRDFEEGRLSGKTTDFFYKSIAEPFIEKCDQDISVTHIDLRDYEKSLREGAGEEENKLIALYKIFSPEHLLKLPFTNDSNTLDKGFYNELLHIIGLKETKEGSKKLIGRKPESERDAGSLVENAINILEYDDCVSQVKASDYGTGKDEQLYHIALELAITWINRILFLKLLEGQLVRYNRGDEHFRFLNAKRILDYDTLNKLFFQVLAVKENERVESIRQKFSNIPYLNSSLFEPGELEHKTIRISNLDDEPEIPLLNTTVLRDSTGKRRTGRMNTLHYLFAFLDAYDFSSEGSEEIQEESKTLINASVLGLIFEKINGYKDGSFFTPGFITMYMCRETIRRAVVQKFNDAKGWNCETISDVFNRITDEKEANRIINSLKICDPAVGSGHFLVSALNEIINIKSELKILLDREGRRLKYYHVEVANDELVVTDEDGELFEYNPVNKESQRIQEALFHEKQALIENCLFGVDINPNSVKICRLRLWIELLKSAYYKAPEPESQGLTSSHSQGLTLSQTLTYQPRKLETLPNIDINIKCGNSLISRYPLDADIKKALSNSTWSVDDYRLAVMTYRNAGDKEVKREMEEQIEQIKSDFESEVAANDKRLIRLNKLKGELTTLTGQTSMFEMTKTEKLRWEREVKKLTGNIEKFEKELEDIRNNKIYENAFEWRFEFPEVLNDDGDFMGFDVVIGNPPYILIQNLGDKAIFDFYKENYITGTYKIDTYQLFYEKSINLLNIKGYLSFISPNTFLKNKHAKNLRELLIKGHRIIEIINFFIQVFEDASVDNLVMIIQKGYQKDNDITFIPFRENVKELNFLEKKFHEQDFFNKNDFELEFDIDEYSLTIIEKLNKGTILLGQIGRAYFGIQTFNRNIYVRSEKSNNDFYPIIDGSNIKRYYYEQPKEYVLYKSEAIKSGGDENVYKRYRIVVRQIGVFPEGVIVEPYLLTLNTVYNIFLFDNIELPLEYLLGLINSMLIKFYWFKKNYDKKATFPKIKKAPLESLPIKIGEENIVKSITKEVNQILNIKKQNPTADTTSLESEIDRMVYDLYGLTDEEIRIVEEAVG
jgi:adenine-specific DNA-methyltransferase